MARFWRYGAVAVQYRHGSERSLAPERGVDGVVRRSLDSDGYSDTPENSATAVSKLYPSRAPIAPREKTSAYQSNDIMAPSRQIRLTIEKMYPTDSDSGPIRLHDDVLVELDIQPGQNVRLTADDGTSETWECQRNDHVPGEEGLVRVPTMVLEELDITIGDSVVVST